MHLVQEQMGFLKDSHQAIGPDALVRFLGMAPELLAATVHTALLLRQPVIQTVTTNVPGPPYPLYLWAASSSRCTHTSPSPPGSASR